MYFYNLHMEIACVSTISIWKLYVFLQFTFGSCMCFYNLHLEVACVSTNCIWKLYVFLQIINQSINNKVYFKSDKEV